MKAFVKQSHEPYACNLMEIERPEPRGREVLLKVAGCGVCGSDLHACRADAGYEWVKTPVILGHEFSGTVVATGSGVESYEPGDRVVAIGIQGCLNCDLCRDGRTNLCRARKVIGLDMDGGMAQYVLVNEAFLIKIPDSLDLNLAALAEPLSVAVHAMDKIRIRPGKNIVVTGPGPIGLMCAVLARAAGAEVTVGGADADEITRLPMARELGFATVNAQRDPLSAIFEGKRKDIWVEASGATTALDSAINLMPRGSDIVVVGLYSRELAWSPTLSVRAEHTVHFSYASAFRDYQYALDLLVSGKTKLHNLAAYFPLERAMDAFAAAEKGLAVKSVIVCET